MSALQRQEFAYHGRLLGRMMDEAAGADAAEDAAAVAR